MKKTALFFAVLILGFVLTNSPMLAQDEGTATETMHYTAQDIYPFGIGLAVSFKGGVNTQDSPGGVKNAYVFTGMPDIGAQIYVPFQTENNMGIILDLAYISYPYKFKLYGNEDVNWVDKVTYFAIAPNFHISGFFVGFNFDIPLDAKTDNNIDGNKFIYDYEKENMNFMIDAHIGGLIPIVNTETGRLNIYIQAEYALSKVFNNDISTPSDVNEGSLQTFNTQPAAIKFGLSYIFNTGLMQKK